MTDPFLTPAEVAEELRIDTRTVYTLIRSGQLKCIDLGHRTKRIYRSDLDVFITDRETKHANS